jgi:hypothetical protein
MEWINVKDRLPEDGDKVLVITNRDNYNFTAHRQENIIEIEIVLYCSWAKQYVVPDGENPRTEVNFNTWKPITHWMPLPSPPKENQT